MLESGKKVSVEKKRKKKYIKIETQNKMGNVIKDKRCK